MHGGWRRKDARGAAWGLDRLKAEPWRTRQGGPCFPGDSGGPHVSAQLCDPGAGGARKVLSRGVLNERRGGRAGLGREQCPSAHEAQATGVASGRPCLAEGLVAFLTLQFCSQVGH